MFKDEETSNFDLEELAQKYHLPLVGVFSKDQLPEKVKVGSYIINLQEDFFYCSFFLRVLVLLVLDRGAGELRHAFVTAL